MLLSFRPSGSENENWLRELAIPLSALSVSIPERTTRVEIAGFPLNLGVSPVLSPLVMSGTVCSREVEIDAKWGKELIYFVGPLVGDGTSGGPVFLSKKGPRVVRVVGMYVGYVSDKTGPKLARVIPSSLIVKVLKDSGEFGPATTEIDK